MEIKHLAKDDIEGFTKLIRVFEEVFEMENFVMPPRGHLQNLLSKPEFTAFVAIVDGATIGGLTAYTLEQYYSTRPLAYVYDLAVKTEFQRRGAGTKLMVAVTGFFREKGYEEVFVQADKIDDYALEFYRSTEISDEEDVSHFYYKFV